MKRKDLQQRKCINPWRSSSNTKEGICYHNAFTNVGWKIMSCGTKSLETSPENISAWPVSALMSRISLLICIHITDGKVFSYSTFCLDSLWTFMQKILYCKLYTLSLYNKYKLQPWKTEFTFLLCNYKTGNGFTIY